MMPVPSSATIYQPPRTPSTNFIKFDNYGQIVLGSYETALRDNDPCFFCSDQLFPITGPILIPQCGHIAHRHCLLKWALRSVRCGHCRQKILQVADEIKSPIDFTLREFKETNFFRNCLKIFGLNKPEHDHIDVILHARRELAKRGHKNPDTDDVLKFIDDELKRHGLQR